MQRKNNGKIFHRNSQIFSIFTFVVFFSFCRGFDYRSEYLPGTTIGLNGTNDEKFNSSPVKDLAMVSGTVPGAKSIEIVEFSIKEIHPGKGAIGRVLGTSNSSADLRNYLQEKIQEIKPSKGNLIIVDNIQAELATVSLLEAWNSTPLSILFSYSSYNVVAEISEISEKDFRNYLNGSIGEKQAEKPRYAEFKGIVFGVTSTDVVVSTARPDKAHSGDVMKFLNRSGKEVAIGIVKEVFHTKVNVALKQGKVDKGFTSVIYGDD